MAKRVIWPYKDPDEVLDYKINWAARLGDDVIDSSEWYLPDGIEMVSDSFVDDATTIWLSGGELGAQLQITNRITTVGGRTMDQSVGLLIKSK